MIDLNAFATREDFLRHVRQRLGPYPNDFAEVWQSIVNARRAGERHRGAGVLLLLHDRQNPHARDQSSTDYVLQLIKRSGQVPQGGDISCPGGMIDSRWDKVLAFLIWAGIIPSFHGPARDYARTRPRNTYRLINLFLANAMRESWEEIRLSPFNVDFLGPLPTYSLTMFKRTIFPVVAYVQKPWKFQPNIEVDKVLEIPVEQLLGEANYAWFTIEPSGSYKRVRAEPHDFPCFVHREGDAPPEILWGATFNIIMTFLEIVFDFHLPAIPTTRQFRRVLTSDYITGQNETPEGG